jgi:predicted Zn finger-like uncharacterized protein
MTVECPRCGTLYRQPARPGRGAETTYRCARCRHVFDTSTDEPAMLTSAAEPSDDDERFSFDEEKPERTPDAVVDRAEVEREASPGREARMTAPARFAIRSVLLVTLGYAVLSVYLYTHPEAAERALQELPLIGARLVETRLHPATVQLTNLRGEYQRVQGDRLVFVITGAAVNNSPVPVRSIQVEGRVLGLQEQRLVVFCGAAPRDVQDLSLREIALLQTLEPPRDWTLAPGAQTSFLVVFTAPPAELREFGAEVVAVQAPSRRT